MSGSHRSRWKSARLIGQALRIDACWWRRLGLLEVRDVFWFWKKLEGSWKGGDEAVVRLYSWMLDLTRGFKEHLMVVTWNQLLYFMESCCPHPYTLLIKTFARAPTHYPQTAPCDNERSHHIASWSAVAKSLKGSPYYLGRTWWAVCIFGAAHNATKDGRPRAQLSRSKSRPPRCNFHHQFVSHPRGDRCNAPSTSIITKTAGTT